MDPKKNVENLGEEKDRSPDGEAHSAVVHRRKWLQYSIRTLLGGTGLIALSLNQYRKRTIKTPRDSWNSFVKYGPGAEKLPLRYRGYMTDALLKFHDDLEASQLNVSDIVSDQDYQERVCSHIEVVLRKMQEGVSDYDLHVDTHEVTLLLRSTHVHRYDRERFSERILTTLRQKLPSIIDSYAKNDRDSVYDALHILLSLHHAGVKLDDVYNGKADFKRLMRRLAEKEIAVAERDSQRQYRTVELCALIEEVVGVDMRKKVSAATMGTLAQRELHRHAESINFTGLMMESEPPGSDVELCLTPNVIARYAGIDRSDPYYMHAKDKTLTVLPRTSTPHILRRKFENGETY